MTMIETVAKALYESWAKGFVIAQSWDSADKASQVEFRHIARTAIEAMRTPTARMTTAGADVVLRADFDETIREVGYAASDVWTAMINAALAVAEK